MYNVRNHFHEFELFFREQNQLLQGIEKLTINILALLSRQEESVVEVEKWD